MKKQSGFTLVELVVAVAILAILASIAIPSYIRYIERAQCEDGKALLSGAANFMERRRAELGGKYTGISLNDFGTSSTVFSIGLSGVSATDYTLTANTKAGARISGSLSIDAANTHGGSLTAKCGW